MTKDYLFTSESVTEGHPDKVADQISDGVLDAIVAGEVTTSCYVDIPKIVRSTICRIGYTDSAMGFDGNTCGGMVAIEGQSQDIARGVDAKAKKEQGAGDQGMMFGYACDETPELMPAPISYAHLLTKRLAEIRRKTHPWLRPDGKSQATVEYRDGQPVRVDTVVVSTQHADDVSNRRIHEAVMEDVIYKALPKKMLDRKTKYFINPTGRFVVGGPQGDTGLTGRKIIVDSYGGMGRHGGGAFSGKDPSKVDRSAAYMGRYVAKNIVAAGLASSAEIQFAYAIGYPDPVSVCVNSFGTGVVSDEQIERAVCEVFSFKPAAIIKQLNLLRPIYSKTTNYGHFGKNDPEISWEKIDKAEALKKAAAKSTAAVAPATLKKAAAIVNGRGNSRASSRAQVSA